MAIIILYISVFYNFCFYAPHNKTDVHDEIIKIFKPFEPGNCSFPELKSVKISTTDTYFVPILCII